MFYDPMISKLCTHGDTRNEAISRMRDALNSYIIRGLNHNGEFLQDLYRHPRFVDGDLNTNFIEKEYPDGFSGIELSNYEIAQIAAVGRYLHDAVEQQDFSVSDGRGGPGAFDLSQWFAPSALGLSTSDILDEEVEETITRAGI